MLDGFALQSPFFGLLHVGERIDESALDARESRIAIEVLEVAEEASGKLKMNVPKSSLT